MAKPWEIIESVSTSDGMLELRQRGERDFLIMVGNQVLMNSLSNRSEVVLGRLGCSHLKSHTNPRVLVGGLGMGFTLRAVLDALPTTASVIVAELNPIILNWCRGPLAGLTDSAASDPRVLIEIGDVADIIKQSAAQKSEARFDAIVLDLYRGPHARTDHLNDPLYGSRAIDTMRSTLSPHGMLAVWGEQYDQGFFNRLCQAGFTVTFEKPGRGGLRHAVFLAKLK